MIFVCLLWMSADLQHGLGYIMAVTTAPNQGPPNQGPPNQGPPNQGPPNQGPPNQGPPNQGPPNQGPPNQGPPVPAPYLRKLPAASSHEPDVNKTNESDTTQGLVSIIAGKVCCS